MPGRRCEQCNAGPVAVLVLGMSAIHRFGVFAGHPLRSHAVLAALHGKWVPTSTVEICDESLVHPEDTSRVWKSSQPDTLAFVNHSLTPNCVFTVRHGDDVPLLQVGDMHIRAWAELTVDYGSSYEPE
jgi:hypothetical protein